MSRLGRSEAQWIGKVTIRLEDFPNEEEVRTCLQSLLPQEFSPQLTDAEVTANGGVIAFDVCAWVDGDGKIHKKTCHGLEPCFND